MRIDRLLANAGLGTRKEVRALIKEGRVFVDEIQIKSFGQHVDPDTSTITVDGEKVNYQPFYYILLNKPAGYVSTTVYDGGPPVTDLLLEYEPFKIVPVGRLDKDTTGVLLLTNNGTLAHRLLSPKRNIQKVYEARLDRDLKPDLIEKFAAGININDEYTTLPAQLKILSPRVASVSIQEGKYHQVKRMFRAFGYEVLELVRTEFAFLNVDDLNLGEHRELTIDEIEHLLSL